MIGLIVTSIILIVIMLVFVFLLFKNIVKKIDDNAKNYFVNKMQNYDYILEEKQENLKEITQKIDELKAEKLNILSDYDRHKSESYFQDSDFNEEINTSNTKTNEIKYDLNIPEYRDASRFFKNYKKIKKIFTINNEKILNSFVKKHKSTTGTRKYNVLKRMREKFDSDSIYSLITLSKEEQIEILNDLLSPREKELIDYDALISDDKFNINDLINNIENKMQEVDPTIYVYVNEINLNYDYIDKNIVTKQYSNMAEGIIIEYRNKIYDYSI